MMKIFKLLMALVLACSIINVNPSIHAEEVNDIVYSGMSVNKTEVVAGDTVSYTFHVNNSLNHINYIYVEFFMPITGASIGFSANYDNGNPEGVYTLNIETDDTFQNGMWKWHYAYFCDAQDNYLFVNNSEVEQESDLTTKYMNLNAYNFTFSGGDNADVTEPVFHGVSIDKKDLLIGQKNTFFIEATDDNKIEYIDVVLESPSGNEVYKRDYFDETDISNNVYPVNFEIFGDEAEEGTWKLTEIYITDQGENCKVVEASTTNFNDCAFNLVKKDPTAIVFDSSKVRLEVGDEYPLFFDVFVDDIAIEAEVTFTSSNTDIVTVDEYGWMNAHALGSAVITATTNNGIKATCNIEVVENITTVFRLAGDNRYATAFATADFMHAIFGRPNTVIIANGENYADALAGSYLAAYYGAPILMTNRKTTVINDLVEYIDENTSEGANVYILGGENAVSGTIDQYLKDRNYNVKRLVGKDRYETNLMILNEVPVKANHILVCTGTGFADSLSVSALGKPILLVGKTLSKAQKEYLQANVGAEIRIIGGTSAVSKKVEYECMNWGMVKRYAGKDRYETSIKVAEKYFDDIDAAVIAYAKNFPDGLSAGPLAYILRAPLILTDSTKNNKLARDYIMERELTIGFTIGGSALITNDAVRTVFGLSSDEEIYDSLDSIGEE